MTQKPLIKIVKNMNMKNPKNVIIYARVTSVENNPLVKEKLEAQLQQCRTYCEENNLDVMTELQAFGPEVDEQVQALLQYLHTDTALKHSLSGVIVSDIDRISRDSSTLTSFKTDLEAMNMVLYVRNSAAATTK